MPTEDFVALNCPLCGHDLSDIQPGDVMCSLLDKGDQERAAECPNCGSTITILYTPIKGDDAAPPEMLVAEIIAEVPFKPDALAMPSRTLLSIFCPNCGTPHTASIHLDPIIATLPELKSSGTCACDTRLTVETVRTNSRTQEHYFVVHCY